MDTNFQQSDLIWQKKKKKKKKKTTKCDLINETTVACAIVKHPYGGSPTGETMSSDRSHRFDEFRLQVSQNRSPGKPTMIFHRGWLNIELYSYSSKFHGESTSSKLFKVSLPQSQDIPKISIGDLTWSNPWIYDEEPTRALLISLQHCGDVRTGNSAKIHRLVRWCPYSKPPCWVFSSHVWSPEGIDFLVGGLNPSEKY